MPRKPKGQPARRKDGRIDRRGLANTQKAPDQLPTASPELLEAERRRVKVAELMGQALTQREIADQVGCAQSTAQGDMTQIREEWRAMRLANFEQAKDEVHGWALHNYRKAHKLLAQAEAAEDRALARLCLQEARKCAELYARLLGLFPANQKDVPLEEALQRLAARLSVPASQLVM